MPRAVFHTAWPHAFVGCHALHVVCVWCLCMAVVLLPCGCVEQEGEGRLQHVLLCDRKTATTTAITDACVMSISPPLATHPATTPHWLRFREVIWQPLSSCCAVPAPHSQSRQQHYEERCNSALHVATAGGAECAIQQRAATHRHAASLRHSCCRCCRATASC